MNYHLHKLYLLIVHFSLCTFWRWWKMEWRPYNQRLNIQHFFTFFFSQLLFFFFFSQQFHFLLLSLSMLTFLCFLVFLIFSSFSIAFFTLMFVWSLELQKHSQLLAKKKKNFQWLPCVFPSLSFPPITFIFLPTRHLLINVWSSELIWLITTIFCVPCTTMWKHFSIVTNNIILFGNIYYTLHGSNHFLVNFPKCDLLPFGNHIT